jgi:hypothetical protein
VSECKPCKKQIEAGGNWGDGQLKLGAHRFLRNIGLSNEHGVTTQKADRFIVTAVITSDLTNQN